MLIASAAMRGHVLAGAWVLFACLSGPVHAGEKTDILTLTNGDEITGEIKKLERGTLRFKTDSLDTVSVIWTDVVGLTSKDLMEVELSSGEKLYGSLTMAEDTEESEERRLHVVGESSLAAVTLSNVIRITPLESTFRERLDGSIKAGLSVAAASDQRDFNFGFNLESRSRKYLRTINANSFISRREGAEDTNRNEVSVGLQRFLGERRYWLTRAEFLKNDELGIDLRSVIGGGYGSYLVQNNINVFSLAGGLVVNHERLIDIAEDNTSLEALAALQYSRVRLHTPEIDLLLGLGVFRTLTEGQRWRAEFTISLRQELVEDLFIDLSGWDSYDSQPGIEGVETNDWGLSTSLGWSW